MRTTQQSPDHGHDNGEAARLITARELASRLGVTTNTIHTWARDGRIPCLRVGRKTLRFDPAAVVAALEANARRQAEGVGE